MNLPTWTSFHVFLSDPEHSQRFLRDWFAPVARRLQRDGEVQGWFFIRYWDGGPHLRLRFRAGDPRVVAELRENLERCVGEFTSANPVSAENYYRSHAFDGQPRDIADLPWYGEGTVAAIPYEPEYIRYGGASAIEVNEQLFQTSSDLALRLLESTGADINQHLLRALSMMAAGILGLTRDAHLATAFFAGYADYWRNYSAAAAAADQAAGDAASPAATRIVAALLAGAENDADKVNLQALWAAGIARAAERFEALWQQGKLVSPLDGAAVNTAEDYQIALQLMLSSQMHMLNNRLGIIPTQECYLARLLANSWRELHR